MRMQMTTTGSVYPGGSSGSFGVGSVLTMGSGITAKVFKVSCDNVWVRWRGGRGGWEFAPANWVCLKSVRASEAKRMRRMGCRTRPFRKKRSARSYHVTVRDHRLYEAVYAEAQAVERALRERDGVGRGRYGTGWAFELMRERREAAFALLRMASTDAPCSTTLRPWVHAILAEARGL